MRRDLSFVSIGVGIFFFLRSANGQVRDTVQPMNLAEIWESIASHNHQLQLQGLKGVAASLAIIEAKDQYLPTISLNGDFKLNTKFLLYPEGLFSAPQDVPVSGYGYGLGYNLNLNLYNGGLDKRNIQLKKEEKLAMQFEYELQHSNLKYITAVAYYELYKFMKFKEFISAEISAEQRQLSTIEHLYKNGIVLKSDVLRIAVKLDNLELRRSEVLKRIDLTKQKLNVLMGRGEMESLQIALQEDMNPDLQDVHTYGDYVGIAQQESQEFKIIESTIKTSELKLRQVKSATRPKLYLYSNYSYTYPQISFYPYSNNLWGFGQTGLRMQWSIDNAFKSKHAVAQANIHIEEQKSVMQIKQEEVNLKIRQAFLQREQAQQQVITAEKNIAQNTETVRVIKHSYLNQESMLTDLLEAENALLEAKFNHISALVELKLNHIQLLAITGIL